MRFYIVNQAISLLLVPTVLAFQRNSNDNRNSESDIQLLVPNNNNNLDTHEFDIDVGILSTNVDNSNASELKNHPVLGVEEKQDPIIDEKGYTCFFWEIPRTVGITKCCFIIDPYWNTMDPKYNNPPACSYDLTPVNEGIAFADGVDRAPQHPQKEWQMTLEDEGLSEYLCENYWISSELVKCCFFSDGYGRITPGSRNPPKCPSFPSTNAVMKEHFLRGGVAVAL